MIVGSTIFLHVEIKLSSMDRFCILMFLYNNIEAYFWMLVHKIKIQALFLL